MAQIMLKLFTIVGENLEIRCSRMAQNALKFSTYLNNACALENISPPTRLMVPPKIMKFSSPLVPTMVYCAKLPPIKGYKLTPMTFLGKFSYEKFLQIENRLYHPSYYHHGSRKFSKYPIKVKTCLNIYHFHNSQNDKQK